MNEELKIIISAVTETAKKNIQGIKKELGDLGKEGKKSGEGIGMALKGIGAKATIAIAAIGVVIAAVSALAKSIVNLSANTKQYREEQARLNAAFMAAGGSTQAAAQAYNGLFRFMGDSDTASEAAAHLAKLTTNEKELAEWTTALQGVYATFGKSLPIEGLTEAANETAKVGKVTGTLADALNWAGINEDAFNASLATANTEAERQAIIRNTLNGLYTNAAQLYEKNNAEIIAQNEAQARLDATTARLGKTTQPLQTALTNLSNALLTMLAPAIEFVSNALTRLINTISKAIGWLANFFGITSGKGASGLADNLGNAGSGIAAAGAGAKALGGSLDGAAKSAEKLKRTTAGFDELNVMSSQSSASGGGGASGGGVGAMPAISGGFALDTTSATDAVEKLRLSFDRLKEVFSPTIGAFKEFGAQVSAAIMESLPQFQSGLDGFKNGFVGIYEYVTSEFIPNLVNSWATNLLPIFGDITVFSIDETAKSFEWLGGLFEDISNDVIIPALKFVGKVTTDTFSGMKKAWDTSGGDLLKQLGIFSDNARKTISDLYYNLIKPVWDELMKYLNSAWDEGLKPLLDELWSFALEVGACITEIYNAHIQPIINLLAKYVYPVVAEIIGSVLDVFLGFYKILTGTLAGAIQSLKGIVQFIAGALTGDWEKAWTGIKNIFGGIWKTIVVSIKEPINICISLLNRLINGIVTGLNTAIRAINRIKLTVPDWVPKIGGKSIGFNLKEISAVTIPALATGGIITSPTLAMMGEGGKKEAVLPLEQNTEWMDKLADKIASRNSTPAKIVLQLDGKELGWATINNLNSIRDQVGYLPLKY